MLESGNLSNEHKTIRALSERIAVAQQPIRILDAIKWGNSVKEEFFRNKAKQLPQVDKAYYAQRDLGFAPNAKREEFYDIERDIKKQLGQFSSVGGIMLRMCREFRTVVRMLEARGDMEFGKMSQELYGSAEDVFYAGAPTLNDLATTLSSVLSNIQSTTCNELDEKKFSAEQAQTKLQTALNQYFQDPEQPVLVEISDGILADASAGADIIKLKADVLFSERDLKMLEVHEGWVHVGTTLNGLSQPVCTFLSKGPPSSTITQEGLAILMEIFTFSSSPTRVKKITNRISAVHMAEQGANFLDVYRYYLDLGMEPAYAYTSASRVFRGSTPEGLPFTKDLAYNKGFISIYNYIKLAIKEGLIDRIPLLFLGKTSLQDIHLYQEMLEQGLIVEPRYVPPQFRDLSGLSAWMCYSLFLNQFNLDKVEQEYKTML